MAYHKITKGDCLTVATRSEAGAVRKARSSGVPVGGETEGGLPEDVLAQAIQSKRGKALRAERQA